MPSEGGARPVTRAGAGRMVRGGGIAGSMSAGATLNGAGRRAVGIGTAGISNNGIGSKGICNIGKGNTNTNINITTCSTSSCEASQQEQAKCTSTVRSGVLDSSSVSESRHRPRSQLYGNLPISIIQPSIPSASLSLSRIPFFFAPDSLR